MFRHPIAVFTATFLTAGIGYVYAFQDVSPQSVVIDVPHEGTRIEIDEDQDDVYEAVQEGRIQPFSALYKAVAEQLNGRVIRVELDEDDDQWIYELRLVHDENVIKVEYDASTLELMQIKGRNLNQVIKKHAQ
ncbi:hypothetical protein TUMSATVNIG1_11740 [Vibrio nigripulchritudo]|uniref:PepSY domain-containing protein n=1 Tax=Vibrio nigripulchritudo TaxID=28173 RepID=UPI00190C2B52|nr:PepSY domain-containing protein [Vibrio nigripulchritudo]BCL69231.1 hypothetical protein VNTUMSATTG_11680 [Vibrio nigripulchritudo]BDU30565.1 hypothetical protein TUMSATVNIG1_11740 [Vibrio nigripulchritudo]